MKKLIPYLILSTIVFAGSCKREIEQISTAKSQSDSVSLREIDGLNTQNQNLLTQFFNGTLTDKSGNVLPQFTVSNFKGMLYFPAKSDMLNYLKALESLRSGWDFTDKTGSDSFDNGADEADLNVGIDAFNAVDASLGFKSMRHYYDSLANQVDNWKAALPYYLEDPDGRIIISSNGDVRIGNDFYHHIDNRYIAVIHNVDENSLQLVKNEGVAVVGPNIEIFDDLYSEIVPKSTLLVPNSPDEAICVFSVSTTLTKDDTDFRKVKIDISSFCSCINPTSTTACLPQKKIKWGDGNTTELSATNSSATHTYDVPSGTSMTFEIEVEVTTIGLCGDCTAQTVVKKEKVTIKDFIETCFDDTRTESYEKLFTYNGKDYKIETDFHQRGKSTWLYSEKLSVETRLYRKNSNGKFKKHTAGKLKTGISAGSILTSTCTIETVIPLPKEKEESDDTVSVKYEPNEEFGTTKSGSREPLCFGAIAIWAQSNLQLWKN